MALKSTVFRAELAVADLDRHYYAEHRLTLARHPAETDLRMMVRLVAFARHAHPDLRFGRGLCQDEEPDLWRREADGTVRLWVTLGQPDPRRLRKACGRAEAVVVYTYQPRAARAWWDQHGEELARLARLRVVHLPDAAEAGLADLVQPRMALTATLQEDTLWLADGQRTVTLHCQAAR